VNNVETKKRLKEMVKEGVLSHISLTDPSLFDPWYGNLQQLVDQVVSGEKEIPDYGVPVTNHPRRSWFATIKINATTGKVSVS
jgi:hypothetical protein